VLEFVRVESGDDTSRIRVRQGDVKEPDAGREFVPELVRVESGDDAQQYIF
jgi:hypothetical protein